MDEQHIGLAIKYGEIIGRNTIDWVRTKITQAKEKNKEEEKQIIYEEIINNLLQDKMDLEMLAREYKDLYEKVTIKDEDIEHLQRTLQHVVKLLSASSPAISENQEGIKLLVQLVNKDTLKTMQLLGFNYKEAIGQPLTEVCANAIRKSLGGNNNSNYKKKK